MKKVFIKENKSGVIQSLIASVLFLVILEPLINIIKGVATKGISALVDYFYYSCSQTNGMISLCMLAVYMLSAFVSREIVEAINLYKAVFPTSSRSNKESAFQNTENTESSLMDQVATIQKLKRKEKILDILYKSLCMFCVVVQVLFFLYFTVYRFAPAIIRESFDRTIIQITPYTEREKIELMQSNWVCMDTKADYDLIVDEINNIREENGLK